MRYYYINIYPYHILLLVSPLNVDSRHPIKVTFHQKKIGLFDFVDNSILKYYLILLGIHTNLLLALFHILEVYILKTISSSYVQFYYCFEKHILVLFQNVVKIYNCLFFFVCRPSEYQVHLSST